MIDVEINARLTEVQKSAEKSEKVSVRLAEDCFAAIDLTNK